MGREIAYVFDPHTKKGLGVNFQEKSLKW